MQGLCFIVYNQFREINDFEMFFILHDIDNSEQSLLITQAKANFFSSAVHPIIERQPGVYGQQNAKYISVLSINSEPFQFSTIQ